MKTVPLGELIAAAKTRRAGTADLPVLSMTMHEGLVDQSAKFKKRVASVDTSDYKVVSRGQLVVGFPIDEGVLDFQSTYPQGIVSPAYGVWDLKDENSTDRNFLRKYLCSPEALGYYKAKLRGSTARRRSLPTSLFLELPVPHPSIEEQRRIAVILDKADDLRAKRRRVDRSWEQLVSAIFYNLFGNPLVNSKGWPVHSLGDLALSMQYGPRFYNESYSPEGIRIVRITDLDYSGRLDFGSMPRMAVTEDDTEKFGLSAGDILFARTGATVGKLALVKESDPPCIAGAYFIRIRLKECLEPTYAAAFLRSRPIQAIIAAGSHQSAQQNFSGPGLRALPCPLPPIELQQQFSRLLKQVEAHRAPRDEAGSAFDELFASLQSRAFSGQL